MYTGVTENEWWVCLCHGLAPCLSCIIILPSRHSLGHIAGKITDGWKMDGKNVLGSTILNPDIRILTLFWAKRVWRYSFCHSAYYPLISLLQWCIQILTEHAGGPDRFSMTWQSEAETFPSADPLNATVERGRNISVMFFGPNHWLN